MRQRWTLIMAAAGLLAVSGCEDAVGVGDSQLVGRWSQTGREADGEFGMLFTSDGKFRGEWRSYGVYEGQPATQLSAYARTEGSYRAEAGQLVLTPKRLVTWDRYYGDNSRPAIEEPYPYIIYFEDARYERTGSTLKLEFTTVGPTDGLVRQTMVLRLE